MPYPREDERRDMVERQLRPRGIHDPRVLAAMLEIPRHVFVPPVLQDMAYDDKPLSIAAGQTISQPYVVAWMAQALDIRSPDKILEIGTGSGYAAAILSRLGAHVHTIERHPELSRSAQARIRELGISNIHFAIADGSRGWPEAGPFDCIVVAAGSPSAPPDLLEQLAIGGRMIIPLGEAASQELYRYRRHEDANVTREKLGGVRFVPLIGEQGWKSEM